jgi:hypothetical protein
MRQLSRRFALANARRAAVGREIAEDTPLMRAIRLAGCLLVAAAAAVVAAPVRVATPASAALPAFPA